MKILKPYDAGIPCNPLISTGDRGIPAWLTELRLDRKYKYFILMCGHFTDMKTQEVYGLWRPARGKYYCEECGKWRKSKPKPKVKPIRMEPMF